jgi:hypothetical protein
MLREPCWSAKALCAQSLKHRKKKEELNRELQRVSAYIGPIISFAEELSLGCHRTDIEYVAHLTSLCRR